MTKRFLTIFFLSILYCSFGQTGSKLKVATFNIRYANPDDGINVWENRRDWVCQSIDFFDVDVFGAQEVMERQLDDMVQRLPDYEHVGIGRNGANKGEFCPVFYRKNAFELLDSDTFWLSETPEKVNSKGWDAALPRIVTWVKLKDLDSEKIFYFFNTHFDHKGRTARMESAKLLRDRIKEIAGKHPFILSGDFNFPPSFGAYPLLTQKKGSDNWVIRDTKDVAEMVYGPAYTFTGFDLQPDQDRERIDYVFCSENMTVQKHHTLDGQRGGNYISDHFPILVCLSFE